MKRTLQLFGSLVFVLLANHVLAACPSNLTAEQMVECIIAENDCQQGRFFRDGVATASASPAVVTNVVKATTPKIALIAATKLEGNK